MLTFGDLPMNAVFSVVRGAFQNRPFKKTATSPDTDRSGGNALYLFKLSHRDGEVLRHPGRHPRLNHFRFEDGTEVIPESKTLQHALNLEQRSNTRRGSKKGKSEWFFDIAPQDLDRLDDERLLPRNLSKFIRFLTGCS